MNLSNDRGKKPFVSFHVILNIVPVALTALKATIKTRELL